MPLGRRSDIDTLTTQVATEASGACVRAAPCADPSGPTPGALDGAHSSPLHDTHEAWQRADKATADAHVPTGGWIAFVCGVSLGFVAGRMN